MKEKNNSIFSLAVYLRWPLILSVLLILLDVVLFVINPAAGAAMLIFVAVFVCFSLGLYVYSRRDIYAGLIDFAQGFESAESRLLNEMGTASAIVDKSGRILWKNISFGSAFTDGDSPNIQDVFPDISREVLSELDEASIIHSSYGEGRYLIELHPAMLSESFDLEESPLKNLYGSELKEYAEDMYDSADENYSADFDASSDSAVYEAGGISEDENAGMASYSGTEEGSGSEYGEENRTDRMQVYDRNDDLLAESDKSIVFITVTDETERIRYKKAYEESRPCEGLIYLDNYDEALASVEEIRRSLLTALVDRRISGYINSLNGIVKKLEKDKYFFFMKEKDVSRMIEDKFSILDEVKTINIGNDMDITLSIGVGKSGKDYNDNYESARAAIEFALGRGGDQAVLKDGENVIFFGGKTEAKEKHARVKARVKAQALRDLLNTCDKLIVMGHKNADVDSLGAAIGFWRIATTFGKKAWIVMGKPSRSLEPLYDRFKNNDAYPDDLFITGDEALDLIDGQTVVAVVDVNRPSITEEPRLLKHTGNITVVDHHRKTAEAIDNAVLTYIEPYASSACEMITEIIQYIGMDVELTPLEADAMYGGITIDTQNFINQTGVRTFEAAAFLKRAGANTTRVRKMFRDSYNDYMAKAEAIDKAEIYRDHFAFSECNAELADSPTVIGAQAANSLLEIDNIKAAIVLTPFNGQIYVSARSIDDVNVQVMMEKLGGGGHMSVAGAQLKNITMEEARAEIKSVIDDMIEQGDIS